MLKGWKTIIFNSGVAVFGVLNSVDWLHMVPGYGGLIVTGIGIVGVILRSITDSPVGQK